MLVNILSTEIKERAIILTVKTVGFLARMGYNSTLLPERQNSGIIFTTAYCPPMLCVENRSTYAIILLVPVLVSDLLCTATRSPQLPSRVKRSNPSEKEPSTMSPNG